VARGEGPNNIHMLKTPTAFSSGSGKTHTQAADAAAAMLKQYSASEMAPFSISQPAISTKVWLCRGKFACYAFGRVSYRQENAILVLGK
jgi:hypothetical protein